MMLIVVCYLILKHFQKSFSSNWAFKRRSYQFSNWLPAIILASLRGLSIPTSSTSSFFSIIINSPKSVLIQMRFALRSFIQLEAIQRQKTASVIRTTSRMVQRWGDNKRILRISTQISRIQCFCEFQLKMMLHKYVLSWIRSHYK